MLKALITGSNGQLGREFARKLGKQHIVKGIDKSENGDIADESFVNGIFEDFLPDIVLHCAAYTDVDLAEKERPAAYRTNVSGTACIAEACHKYRARMVYISTDYVFGGAKPTPYDETDRPDPINYYGLTKYLGEQAVCSICSRYQIIRTSWLYSADGNNFLTKMLDMAKTRSTIDVVCDQTGTPTYVPDLADAVMLLADTGDTGIYHVTNSGRTTWFDYARLIFEYLGARDISIRPVSAEAFQRPAKRPAYSVLETAKFAAVTGCRPRAWDVALKDCVSSLQRK